MEYTLWYAARSFNKLIKTKSMYIYREDGRISYWQTYPLINRCCQNPNRFFEKILQIVPKCVYRASCEPQIILKTSVEYVIILLILIQTNEIWIFFMDMPKNIYMLNNVFNTAQKQYSTYHGLCYTSCGGLVEMINAIWEGPIGVSCRHCTTVSYFFCPMLTSPPATVTA